MEVEAEVVAVIFLACGFGYVAGGRVGILLSMIRLGSCGSQATGALQESISVIDCMYVNRELEVLSAEFSWV